MYRSFFAVLFVLLACYTTSSAAASADCLGQKEIPANQSRKPTDLDINIGGVTYPLPNNRNYTFQSGANVNASSTVNISTVYTANVLDSFSKVFNVSFSRLEYTFGTSRNVSSHTVEIENGPPGFDDFSEVVSQGCYTGVVERGCFDDIPIGTPVSACRSLPLKDDGSLNEDSIRPSATAPSTTAPLAPTVTPQDNGAVNLLLLGQGDWRSTLLMTMIVTTVVRTGVYFIAFWKKKIKN